MYLQSVNILTPHFPLKEARFLVNLKSMTFETKNALVVVGWILRLSLSLPKRAFIKRAETQPKHGAVSLPTNPFWVAFVVFECCMASFSTF